MLTTFFEEARASADTLEAGLAQMLQPESHIGISSPDRKILSHEECVDFLKAAKGLQQQEYAAVVEYLQDSEPDAGWHSQNHFPVPDGKQVVPHLVIEGRPAILFGNKRINTLDKHLINSAVRFRAPGTDVTQTGHIGKIWTILIGEETRIFLVVQPHQHITLAEFRKTGHGYCNIGTELVEVDPQGVQYILEMKHIISHLTMYLRPAGVFPGISRPLYAISTNLDRGRRYHIVMK